MPDLRTRLVTGVVFPLQEFLKGHDSVRRRRALERSQWWSRQELEDHRVRRLRDLLTRAAAHVPYYRDLFVSSGFDVTQVSSVEALQRLPFLTKRLIRANTRSLASGQASKLKRYNTGGSSGEPLIFYMGKDRISHDVAAKWRATRWWGVDIGDPEIVVWGSPIELGAQDRVRGIRDRLLRTRLLAAFEMSPAKLDQFVAAIRAMRPRMIFGYPSALALIGRHAQSIGQRLDDLGIKVAFVTAERLYDHQRAQIAAAFGARVANGYGGRDAGFVAHECPEGGMHISAEDIIVEIVDPAGKVLPVGESGEIVVTHLATRDFPFIRYRTGDIAIIDDRPCPCGRGLPLMREIQGRSTDFVVAHDGTVMHGLALIYVLRDMPEITSFKIIQESRERVRVLVVPARPLTEAVRRAIDDGLRARLGQAVMVDIEETDEIPAERSGKFRYVLSKVDVTNPC
jgi:phenylacetate-CoA ligase